MVWRKVLGMFIAAVVIGVLLAGALMWPIAASAQTDAVGNTSGYTLFAPLQSKTTYLIDESGTVVHTWESAYNPGNAVYLLENGHLLRTANVALGASSTGGTGGRVEEYNWDGELVWAFDYATPDGYLHHDIEMLPNGHVLMIASEEKSPDEVRAAGRTAYTDGLSVDYLIEVDPMTNQIVWEWHVWDHLVQDMDPALPNYGVVSAHPERINVNFSLRPNNTDWNHTNAVDYNAELDQVMLSVHNFSEIWIIDHSTTTAEAATSAGGRSGQGGDLLYRWGNPQTYDAGSAADQQFFLQHDAQWIEAGLPGAGNILVFNNGDQRARPYSSVDEIVPPLNADGTYAQNAGTYGPVSPVWSYTATTPIEFYAVFISGAQRLASGNTLICDGPAGHFFEVTPDGVMVWEYTNTFGGTLPGGAGQGGPGGANSRPALNGQGANGPATNGQRPALNGQANNGANRSNGAGQNANRPNANQAGMGSSAQAFRAVRYTADYPGLAALTN